MIQPLSSADINIFALEISNFCYIKKCRYRMHFKLWNIKHQSRLKALHKFYYSKRYFGHTGWSRFQTDQKNNAKPSLNTEWHQISMKRFHFFEQRFLRICLNKASIISVQHFILPIPDYHHISSKGFLNFLS